MNRYIYIAFQSHTNIGMIIMAVNKSGGHIIRFKHSLLFYVLENKVFNFNDLKKKKKKSFWCIIGPQIKNHAILPYKQLKYNNTIIIGGSFATGNDWSISG